MSSYKNIKCTEKAESIIDYATCISIVYWYIILNKTKLMVYKMHCTPVLQRRVLHLRLNSYIISWVHNKNHNQSDLCWGVRSKRILNQ